jgi:hypothetical protein
LALGTTRGIEQSIPTAPIVDTSICLQALQITQTGEVSRVSVVQTRRGYEAATGAIGRS